VSGIEDVGRMTDTFRLNNKAAISSMLSTSKKYRDSCSKVESSWSGSYFGWHSRMYFRDFETPSRHEMFSTDWGDMYGLPEGWQEKQTGDVKTGIELLVGDGFSIDGFESDIKRIQAEAEEMKHEVLILISTVPAEALTPSEQRLQTEIENFELGKGRQYFARQRMPQQYSTHDREAGSQGVRMPAWLYYDNIGLEAESVCEAVDKFIRLTDRLARQLLAKEVNKPQLSHLHPVVFDKCFKLYSDGYYSEAAEKSFKAVKDRLRDLTGCERGDGAFGSGLYIRGAAAPNVDEDFQKGVQFLTMANDRFRNEKSHTSDAKISDPIRAYQYLAVSSLVMSFLDNAEIRKP